MLRVYRFHACLFLSISFALAHAAFADDNHNVISAAKAATALVVLPEAKGFASCFCIDPAGYFVTSAHVVASLGNGAKLSIVLNAGETDEKQIEAIAMRVDKEGDLAILKAEGVSGLPALALGSSENLMETQQVTALGYPFGKALALEKATFPNVSVNMARVTSLRKAKGKLEFVQLDSQLNPGNSGGPVIDEKGAVIGVVRSGVLAAGINFAVPVHKLTALLDKPEIICTLPNIPDNQRNNAIDLTIRTATFGRAQPDLSVEVILISSDGKERTFPAKADGSTYTAKIIPMAQREGPIRYPLEIVFPDGSMRCSVEDITLQLDGKDFALSTLSAIDLKEATKKLTRRDGSTATGTSLIIPALNAGFGDYFLSVDPAKAKSLTIGDPDQKGSGVSYRIVAKSKGVVVAEKTGPLIGAGASIGVSASGGGWIDLLPRVDIKRDTDSGEWTFDNGVLKNVQPENRGVTSRLTIPVMPVGDYELEYTFIRVKGSQDHCVLLPVAGHGAQLWVGSFTGQTTELDGTGVKARNDLVRIINDKPQHMHLTIKGTPKEASVELQLNGVDFLSWKGDTRRLQVNPERATRDGRTLGLAVYASTTVEFQDLRVRPLTGSIKPYVTGE